MAGIHPTAIVADGAQLGADVTIGPYCVVGPKVRLGDGVALVSHVCIDGITDVGAGTRIFPFAVIGRAASMRTGSPKSPIPPPTLVSTRSPLPRSRRSPAQPASKKRPG